MNIRLTELEARTLPGELKKLGEFLTLATKLGWRTHRRTINRRLRILWWKYHEK